MNRFTDDKAATSLAAVYQKKLARILVNVAILGKRSQMDPFPITIHIILQKTTFCTLISIPQSVSKANVKVDRVKIDLQAL